ncbi:hypothetical protein WKH56_06475 [Priestia sp. SB1]|uniref:hypothetical protein n=1 Tax=Priestia sp. SB1 TaxID=3132359 RepID=UPI00316F2A49
MNKKIEEVYSGLSGDGRSLAKLAEHYEAAITALEEQNRRTIAIDALSGIKPNLEEQAMFKETLYNIKRIIISELEKTVADIEHQGDKNWTKYYKDGVI